MTNNVSVSVCVCVCAALYWFNYELVKARLCEEQQEQQASFSTCFTAGAVSGAVSTSASWSPGQGAPSGLFMALTRSPWRERPAASSCHSAGAPGASAHRPLHASTPEHRQGALCVVFVAPR